MLTINIQALVGVVKNDRRKFIAWLCGFGIAGIVVAFSIPKEYSTTVTLAPETSGNSMLSSVTSLASMVGLYNDANPTGDAIYPEIYPDLMGSTDFVVSLFNIKVKSKDGSVHTTYYDYLNHYQKRTWWSYPFLAMSKMINKLKGEDGVHSDKVNPFWLTREQEGVVKTIGKNVSCSVDKMTSVISITVVDQDPYISAVMADSVKNVLQKYITNYKTTKARNDLKYIEGLYDEAKDKYVKMRQRYAAYSDANTDVILASARLKQEDLENDMQLQYNIYNQLAQQVQMARAKVQERTPAFTVIQAASVPLKHCNKPKVLYLAVFLFLGFMCRILTLIVTNRKTIIEI